MTTEEEALAERSSIAMEGTIETGEKSPEGRNGLESGGWHEVVRGGMHDLEEGSRARPYIGGQARLENAPQLARRQLTDT